MLISDRLLWTKDGKNGPDDPTNSMSILLKWHLKTLASVTVLEKINIKVNYCRSHRDVNARIHVDCCISLECH